MRRNSIRRWIALGVRGSSLLSLYGAKSPGQRPGAGVNASQKQPTSPKPMTVACCHTKDQSAMEIEAHD